MDKVASLLLCLCFAGQLSAVELAPPTLVAERIVVDEHKLIRVKLIGNERIFVTKTDSKGELAFIETDYWADFNGSLLGKVWVASPGNYSMVVVPEARDQEPRYIIVTIKGNPDEPDPDDPDPDPDPEPDPDVVPNKYGIGQLAFDAARKVNDKGACSILAAIYASASSQLAATPDDPNSLVSQINEAYAGAHRETNEQLAEPGRIEKWASFRNSMKGAIEDAWRKGFTSKQDAVNILQELSRAMELASK